MGGKKGRRIFLGYSAVKSLFLFVLTINVEYPSWLDRKLSLVHLASLFNLLFNSARRDEIRRYTGLNNHEPDEKEMELTNLLKIPWADSGLFSFFFRFLQWCRDKVTGLFIARAQFSWLPCFSVDEGWKIAFCFSLLPSSHLIFPPLAFCSNFLMSTFLHNSSDSLRPWLFFFSFSFSFYTYVNVKKKGRKKSKKRRNRKDGWKCY